MNVLSRLTVPLAALAAGLMLGGPVLGQSPSVAADSPKLKVGDTWKFRTQDISNKREVIFTNTVTTADDTEALVQGSNPDGRRFWWIYDQRKNSFVKRFNHDEAAADKRGNLTADWSANDSRVQFPLQQGKKWTVNEKFRSGQYGLIENDLKAEVVAFEKIRTPAGEFDAFKVEFDGWWNNRTSRNSGKVKAVAWYAPAIKRPVRSEYRTYVDGRVWDESIEELLEFKAGQ